MSIRAITIFFPMCSVLFLNKKIDNKYILISMLLSPMCVVLTKFLFNVELDILYIGLLVSFLIMFIGYIFSGKATD